jgi:hypothetical protein
MKKLLAGLAVHGFGPAAVTGSLTTTSSRRIRRVDTDEM